MACDHIVAHHDNSPIRISEWPKEAELFARSANFFLLNAYRLPLPHPGMLRFMDSCPECGRGLDGKALQQEFAGKMGEFSREPCIDETQYRQRLCGTSASNRCQTGDARTARVEFP